VAGRVVSRRQIGTELSHLGYQAFNGHGKAHKQGKQWRLLRRIPRCRLRCILGRIGDEIPGENQLVSAQAMLGVEV